MKPGSSLTQVNAQLTTLAEQMEQEQPRTNRGTRYFATSLRDSLVGDTRRPLTLLLAAVGVVLLIACVNVGNRCSRGRSADGEQAPCGWVETMAAHVTDPDRESRARAHRRPRRSGNRVLGDAGARRADPAGRSDAGARRRRHERAGARLRARHLDGGGVGFRIDVCLGGRSPQAGCADGTGPRRHDLGRPPRRLRSRRRRDCAGRGAASRCRFDPAQFRSADVGRSRIQGRSCVDDGRLAAGRRVPEAERGRHSSRGCLPASAPHRR